VSQFVKSKKSETAEPVVETPKTEPVVLHYCVKCKEERQMVNPTEVVGNGRKRLVGTCATCGSKMSRFIKSDAPAAIVAPVVGEKTVKKAVKPVSNAKPVKSGGRLRTQQEIVLAAYGLL